jgi:hypothetical protein
MEPANHLHKPAYSVRTEDAVEKKQPPGSSDSKNRMAAEDNCSGADDRYCSVIVKVRDAGR